MPADLDLLFKSFLYIVKKIQRDAMRRHGGVLTGTVLDAGCGGQGYRRYIPAERYVGMEYNRAVRPELLGDVQHLPFGDDTFDNVLCTEVLEHVPEPGHGMDELFRVLKPGGRALITVPMSWNLHYVPYDFYRYTRYGLAYLAERSGFEVERMERLGGFWALFGSRLVDTGTQVLMRPIKGLPTRWRHGLLLLFSVPTSLLFWVLSRLLDNLDDKDTIGWITVLRKPA